MPQRLDDMVEHRRVERLAETAADLQAVAPGDRRFQALHAGYRQPDDLPRIERIMRFRPEAGDRQIEQANVIFVGMPIAQPRPHDDRHALLVAMIVVTLSRSIGSERMRVHDPHYA